MSNDNPVFRPFKLCSEEYIKYRGQLCPHCLSGNLSGGKAINDGTGLDFVDEVTASYPVACKDCKAQWFEYFNLVGYVQEEDEYE